MTLRTLMPGPVAAPLARDPLMARMAEPASLPAGPRPPQASHPHPRRPRR